MAEKHEELLDEWFFEHQESGPSLDQFLCNDKLEFCCPQGYYGPECSPCPGIKQSEKVCFGRGGCDVIEKRQGFKMLFFILGKWDKNWEWQLLLLAWICGKNVQ
jgi:hypothetical protein